MNKDRALTDVEIFLTVVNENGFTAAARKLAVTQSTLTRRIQALEQRLSAQLLTRTTRRIALTDLGHLYLEKCKVIVPLLVDAQQTILARATEPEGTLRIVAPTSLGRAHIVPLVAKFCRTFPKLNIDVSLMDRHVHLIDEGFDIAIMLGDLPDSSFVKRSLGEMPLAICGSPDYLGRRGIPMHPDDLRNHECIYYRSAYGRLDWEFFNGKNRIVVHPASQLVLNDTSATLVAAVSGAGLARIPTYLAQRALQTKRLVRVLDDWRQETMPVSVVYAAGRRSEAKIKTFVDFMTKEFRIP